MTTRDITNNKKIQTDEKIITAFQHRVVQTPLEIRRHIFRYVVNEGIGVTERQSLFG
jgi:hypothetical protein